MNMTKRKIKLVVHYDGSRYHGWAAQPGRPTIQGAIQEALEALCGQGIEVVGSSRTDAGVHALGQVAHADLTGCPVPTANLQKALNNRLPGEIAVAGVEEVPESFDAIRSTLSKEYRYTIYTDMIRPVLEIHRCWHYPYPVSYTHLTLPTKRIV